VAYPVQSAEARIGASFTEHEALLAECRKELIPVIAQVTEVIRQSLAGGNKIMLCGNGGSAADSQHIAAELIGRFKKERRPLSAIALTTDTSILTSLGNDYHFEDVFSRQVRGLAKPGDVFVGISTSGNSGNITAAALAAHEMGCTTVALTGNSGGRLASLCSHAIIVPSRETARIQEMHILIGHILCELLEE
jgi:D-sedoheptulose 7-phosphate isomerase